MISISRSLLVGASLLFIASNGQADPILLPSFGAWAQGQDLEPTSINISDGGPGTSNASVSFGTFDVESTYDPNSTYLPTLRARANGLGATVDDDRTSTEAVAYEIFTSDVAQTIDLQLTLDSTLSLRTPLAIGRPYPSAGVILDIWVFLDPVFDTFFCSGGERMSFGTYICGEEVAYSNTGHTTRWREVEDAQGNVIDIEQITRGSDNMVDTLAFEVGAGQQFGIYAELSASAFQGTADAFNTASLEFLALRDSSNIAAISPPDELPLLIGTPSEIPLPAAVWMFGAGLIGLFGFARKKTTT